VVFTIRLFYANVQGSVSTQNSHKWTQSATGTTRLECSFAFERRLPIYNHFVHLIVKN